MNRTASDMPEDDTSGGTRETNPGCMRWQLFQRCQRQISDTPPTLPARAASRLMPVVTSDNPCQRS